MSNTFLSYHIPDGNVAIVSIGAASYPQGYTAYNLQSQDEKYWLQTYRGDTFVCFVGDADKAPQSLTYLDANNNSVSVESKPFTLIPNVPDSYQGYVGGFPPYFPKPTK